MRGRKIIAGLLSVMLVLAAVFAGNATSAKAADDTIINISATNCSIYYKTASEWVSVSTGQLKFDSTSVASMEIKVMPNEGCRVDSATACTFTDAANSNPQTKDLSAGGIVDYESNPNTGLWGGGVNLTLGAGTYTLTATAEPDVPGVGQPEPEPSVLVIEIGAREYPNITGDSLIVADFDTIDNLEYWIKSVDGHALTNVGNKSSITDTQGRNPLEVYTVKRGDNYITVNLNYHAGDDPTEANQAYGFYVTNITFANAGFQGIEIASTGNKPDMYDDTVYSNYANLAENQPEVMAVYYGNNTVDFGTVTGSSRTITNVALGSGISPSAVTIDSNTHQVTFNSPYYDTIPLTITLNGGASGTVIIKRLGIEVGDYSAGATVLHGSQNGSSLIGAPGAGEENIVATFYHDAAKSYSDYNMVANLTFADGRTETVVKSGFADVTCIDTALEGSDYIIWSGSASEKPVKVSVTAVEANAVQTTNSATNTSFGGASFGSGAGVTWNIRTE